tara:strand:- start:398 stop:763 length:366 start_codon:yes stop_codon:yes gene_type:complete
MNKFVSVLVLGSALALSACGGDSDSSGSNNTTPAKPTPTNPTPNNPKPTNPTSATCASTGTSPATVNVTVPNNGSCTYSASFVNSGAKVTYSCSNGTLNAGGSIHGSGSVNLNNYQFSCAK